MHRHRHPLVRRAMTALAITAMRRGKRKLLRRR
jgi:hypothetical protein